MKLMERVWSSAFRRLPAEDCLNKKLKRRGIQFNVATCFPLTTA